MNIDIKDNLNTFAFAFILLSFFLRLLSLGSHHLIPEEAYYWNYSAHLDFGYLDHPPMVALLIKTGTMIFGTHEFGVRIASFLCWIGTVYFSCKLTECIHRGAGIYAALLLSLLPFFFIHSILMTPDQPLTLCWSAALYCLYCALVMEKSSYWYGAGIWIGLGMLSKYTMVLLVFPTLVYCCLFPSARMWFIRTAPYLSVIIAALLFSPVIYWNATHHWVSFFFQGPSRFNAPTYFAFHHFIGLLILFLTPLGLICTWFLFQKQVHINRLDQRFLQLFASIPLIFFGLFSLHHQIKFNWIGPSLLALIPWLAVSIKTSKLLHYKAWIANIIGLFFLFSMVLLVLIFNYPKIIYQPFATKLIDWEDLTHQVHRMVSQTKTDTSSSPLIMALDTYNINSELAFYQAKSQAQLRINKQYPIIGQHIFQRASLMYEYWSEQYELPHKTLLLISEKLDYFNDPEIKRKFIAKSPILTLWSHSPRTKQEIKPFYYVIGELS